MNRRLANDQITESDPKFPKRLFPSQAQCPNCYLPSVRNIDELSEHESPWNTRECLLFLTSYYSRVQIVPIDEATPVNSLPDSQVNVHREVDEPHVPDAIVDRAPAENNENGGRPIAGRFMGVNHALLGDQQVNPDSSLPIHADMSLTIMFFLAAFASFGVVYIYLNYFRRINGKAKKHIIWLK